MVSKMIELNKLLIEASVFGLSEVDIRIADEFLQHREYALCLDHLLQQLYEFDIKIDSNFYQLTHEMGKTLNLPKESFEYIRELIS